MNADESGAGAGSATKPRLVWELDGDVWSADSAWHDEGTPFRYRITAGAGAKHEPGVSATVFELGGDGEVVPPVFRGKLATGSAGLEALKALCQELEDGKHDDCVVGHPARMSAAAGGRRKIRRGDAAGPLADARGSAEPVAGGGEALGGSGGSAPQAVDLDAHSRGEIDLGAAAQSGDGSKGTGKSGYTLHAQWCGIVHGGVCNCQLGSSEFAMPAGDDGQHGLGPAGDPYAAAGIGERERRALLSKAAKNALEEYRTAHGSMRAARVNVVAAVFALLRGAEQREWAGLLAGAGQQQVELKALVGEVLKEL